MEGSGRSNPVDNMRSMGGQQQRGPGNNKNLYNIIKRKYREITSPTQRSFIFL